MDFFQHQERARRKTSLLVVYFIVAVVLIIVAVYLAVAVALFYGQSRVGHHGPPTLWFPDVFAAVSLGTLLIVGAGSLFKIAELARGGEVVARALGGRPVLANTRDLSERVLLNVVEEMAIASGTPVPPVYLLDNESAINAFAAGTSPQNAVIGVTRGSIQTLSRYELQGVIAHEFSHILNGDMRLNIRLIGILNGILLIATIGYILMRTSSSSSNFSSSGGKKGNPLPLLGLLLYIIGYVGVFFGNLIKSAVSRQREFLADASAVQFTRLPDGISGALKKIGGYVHHSRLKTEHAQEASHMYFGNGVAAPLFELLATHPPLRERIHRIDPKFAGLYPKVQAIEHSVQDLVDPNTLAARRAAFAPVHAIAAAGAQTLAVEPDRAVEQVGAPRNEHLDYAAALVASLPEQLATNLRDPLGALATVYALLLAEQGTPVCAEQLEYLANQADPKSNAETLRVWPLVAKLPPEARLPLVSMTLPALHALAPKQLAAFRRDVTFLIHADRRLSLFEYGVQRLVLKRLLPRLERQQPSEIKYQRLAPLAPAASTLLSTLAHCGTRDEAQVARAFALGVAELGAEGTRAELLPRDDCSLKSVDVALDQLAAAAPLVKRPLLEACAACIGADDRVTVEEGELLRIISDALACPMPPLLPLPIEHPRG
jgi:Zn-dependent protease with chaperone function